MSPPLNLPPGQAPAEHRPFGLPDFGPTVPRPSPSSVVTVTGAVRLPTQVPVAELAGLSRADQLADLHCVTTWSALGLSWRGVPFAVVHEHLAGRVLVRSGARWVKFTGLDGYCATLRLDDALDPDVLLVDTLHGTPLTVDDGAPLRLVAPAHYGYKSVKHVCQIEYRTAYDSGSAGWKGHPRGRTALEGTQPLPAGTGMAHAVARRTAHRQGDLRRRTRAHDQPSEPLIHASRGWSRKNAARNRPK